MAMKYKIDIIAALKEAGYNTSRIRKEKIMGEAMLQKIEQQKKEEAELEAYLGNLDRYPYNQVKINKE